MNVTRKAPVCSRRIVYNENVSEIFRHDGEILCVATKV